MAIKWQTLKYKNRLNKNMKTINRKIDKKGHMKVLRVGKPLR